MTVGKDLVQQGPAPSGNDCIAKANRSRHAGSNPAKSTMIPNEMAVAPGKRTEYWIVYDYTLDDVVHERQQVRSKKKHVKALVKHLESLERVSELMVFKRKIRYGEFKPLKRSDFI